MARDRQVVEGHGYALGFGKTEMLRPRQAAEESVDDRAWYWTATEAADLLEKNLCHSMADKDKNERRLRTGSWRNRSSGCNTLVAQRIVISVDP